MTDARPKVEHDKFIVRLPYGMRDRIADEAKANNRSMNAEIVSRLERTFVEGNRIKMVAEGSETLDNLLDVLRDDVMKNLEQAITDAMERYVAERDFRRTRPEK
jgi:hypothetical protein